MLTICPGLDEAALVREDDGLDAVAEVELGEDPTDVGLHGGLRDDELGGDLLVGEAPRHEQQHLVLALGEELEARGRSGGDAGPGSRRGCSC
jgi:hypothetical protein